MIDSRGKLERGQVASTVGRLKEVARTNACHRLKRHERQLNKNNEPEIGRVPRVRQATGANSINRDPGNGSARHGTVRHGVAWTVHDLLGRSNGLRPLLRNNVRTRPIRHGENSLSFSLSLSPQNAPSGKCNLQRQAGFYRAIISLRIHRRVIVRPGTQLSNYRGNYVAGISLAALKAG